MAVLKKNKAAAVMSGGCGCANAVQQSGGSLASDAVVSLVDKNAWIAMDEQATNQFAPAQQQNGGTGIDAGAGAVGMILKTTANLLMKPMAAGSPTSLHDLISANLAGPVKKTYSATMKKYGKSSSSSSSSNKIAKGGDGQSSIDKANNLVSFLSPNFTNVMSKLVMSGGGGPDAAKMANSLLDHLTLSGAKTIGKLLRDASVFKGGRSIVEYVAQAAKFAAGENTKSAAVELTGQHGGAVLNLLASLSAANLEKVSALVGGKAAYGGITTFIEGANNNKPPTKVPAQKKKLLKKQG